MRISERQRAVLLYGSTIFGAFALILLLIITVFSRHFYTLNILDPGVIERYKTMFTGIGILFIPAGLFFAYAIGWIISQELYPRRPRQSITTSPGGVAADGGDPAQFRERMHNVRSTISNMQTAYEQIQNFSANASHELRTPLTIMRGEIELALRRAKTVEEYQNLLGSLLEEILRLSRILDDLLLIAKTEIGERPLETQPVDLRELVEEIADEASLYAEQAGVRFILESTVDAWIDAEPLRIRRVLLNLVDNAVKYNRQNGTVSISMRKEDDVVAVSIKDTGIGIPPEALPRLFERFYRVNDSGAAAKKGTGLGLYLVQWIVKNHGGSITVDSVFGEWSEFSVRLPLRNAGV